MVSMNVPPQDSSESRDCQVFPMSRAVSTSQASHDQSEASAVNGEQYENAFPQQENSEKNSVKKVQIVDPGPSNDPDSDDEDSLSHPGLLERPSNISLGESAVTSGTGQSTDSQVVTLDRKKTREERKKEREKKKEEEMLKKYHAEQEAKQKISAKSKCGRWIKHNLQLGKGGYKFVYRGYDTVEAKNVAWCEFKREHVDTKEKRQAMFKETEIMLKMNHPHIVRCFDVFREWIDMDDPNNPTEEKGLVIIQELMEGGTLKSAIRKNFVEGHCILRFSLITRWLHQILDALRYMHHRIQPSILHRDLKADNCFLYGVSDGECLNVKVGDFGLATHVNNSGRKTMLGTLGFMAPEIFDENYDEKVDIYAFGMLMLEVMTNRTPYSECETVMQVAAKTMSGQGPEIMDRVLNPSLREVISACIHPLTCFRPTAEELYFHPLFQRYQGGDDSWPKTLSVEVEPNYDNATDRAEVLDRFVRSLEQPETRNPNFNLRLRFRDKKMLQELGLDDGESLEFDLDIYKAEDQDIPDLIHNLRLGYEDKLWRVFENPKQPDKKIVSSHLDKLFNSIRLQMQFLVKVLLGKRWKAILDSLVDESRSKKKQDGSSAVEEADDSDTDGQETSSFTLIGKYKTRWGRAKRMLEREIQAYRNATATVSSVGSNAIPAPQMIPSSTVGPSTSAVPPRGPSPEGSTAASVAVSTAAAAQVNSSETQDSSVPPHTNIVATVGKFLISTPASPSVAPASGPLPQVPLPIPSDASQDVSQKQTQEALTPVVQPPTVPTQSSVSAMKSELPIASDIPPSDIASSQPAIILPLQPPTVSVQTTSVANATSAPSQPITSQVPMASEVPPIGLSACGTSDVAVSANLDNSARSAMLLQQVLQTLTSGSLLSGTSTTLDPTIKQEPLMQAQLGVTAYEQALPQRSFATNPTQSSFGDDLLIQSETSPSLVPEPVIGQDNPMATQWLNQLTEALLNAAAATNPSSIAPQLLRQKSTPQPSVSNQISLTSGAQPLGPVMGAAVGPTSQPSYTPQPMPLLPTASCKPISGSETPSPTLLLNQLAEALFNVAASANQHPTASQLLMQKSAQQTLASNQISMTSGNQSLGPNTGSNAAPPSQPTSQSAQFLPTASTKLPVDRKPRKKPKSKPRYILRVTKVERDPEGSEQGTLRPTFYLEMPDPENPNSELWKLSFRCNLSDTQDDIKLFQGHTQVDPDVDRAAKDMIVQLLDALRTDSSSVKLNQDYVFYPRPSTQPVSFTTADLSAPIAGQPRHLGSGLSSTVPSSHTSLGASSSASRSLIGQIGAPLMDPPTFVQPLSVISSASALYDTSAAAQNLEEVLPVDRSLNPSFTTGLEDSAQQYIRVRSNTGVADTVHDEEDEDASDGSRSFSPAEINPLPSQSIVSHDNGVDLVSVPKPDLAGSQTPYFSACSSTSAVHGPRFFGTNTVIPMEQSETKSATFAQGIQYVQDLLAMLVGKPAYLRSYTTECQQGLEEVSPLPPPPISNQLVMSTMHSYDSQIDLNASESVSLNHGDAHVTTAHPGPVPRAPQTQQQQTEHSINPSHATGLINVTWTIPATLEHTLVDLIYRLCTSPFLSHIVLPASTGPMADASPGGVPHMRVVEIPEGHLFVGKSGSGSVNTFKFPDEPAVIILGDPRATTGDASATRIFRLPPDSALVIGANGSAQFVDKAAIVVPTPPTESHRSASSSMSPVSDPTEGVRQHPSSSRASVQVRDLPFQSNMDTLTLDDVLHLLLALRSTSQPSHRSATVSPTPEGLFISSVQPTADYHLFAPPARQVSVGGGSQSHFPQQATNLAQLQQMSVGQQYRPLSAPHQLSQTLPSAMGLTAEQSHTQFKHVQGLFRPPQPNMGNVDSIGSTHSGVLPKDWFPDPGSFTYPSAYGAPTGAATGSSLKRSHATHTSNPVSGGVVHPYQAPPQPPQVPTQSAPLDPVTLQRAIQVLSALNSAVPPEQLSVLLAQIARSANPAAIHSGSSNVLNPQRQNPSVFNPPHIATNVCPPIVNPVSQNVGSTNQRSQLPVAAIPGRPHGSVAFSALEPGSDLFHGNVTSMTGAAVRPAFVPSHQSSIGTSSVHLPVAIQGGSGSVPGIQPQKKPLQQTFDQAAQQSISYQTGVQHPANVDLGTILRLLQRQPESSMPQDLWAAIPADLQNRLLAFAQTQVTNQVQSSAVGPVALQPPTGTSSHILQTNLPPQPVQPIPGAGVAFHLSQTPVTPATGGALQSANASDLANETGQTGLSTAQPQPSAPISTCSAAPVNAITVANKFTVVPVHSENEEPLAPIVGNTQGPPRPPRQRPTSNQAVAATVGANSIPQQSDTPGAISVAISVAGSMQPTNAQPKPPGDDSLHPASPIVDSFNPLGASRNPDARAALCGSPPTAAVATTSVPPTAVPNNLSSKSTS